MRPEVLGLSAERFAVLMIGNDLRNKGFRVLLEAPEKFLPVLRLVELGMALR